jgi:uncharacterized protein YbjT (DUF2867 family)
MSAAASYKVLVAGATGACGQAIVRELVATPRCEEVIALCRRANVRLPFADAGKVRVIVLEDFGELTLTPAERRSKDCPLWSLSGVGAAVCALGTTMKDAGGSKEVFQRVDHDYICGFVRTALACGARKIALISASGASERSLFFYMRVKGETEKHVQALCAEYGAALHILRPGMLLTPPRTSGASRPAERAAQQLVKTLRLSMGGILAVSVEHVAKTVRMALETAPEELLQRFSSLEEQASQTWVYPSRTIFRIGAEAG